MKLRSDTLASQNHLLLGFLKKKIEPWDVYQSPLNNG